MGVETATYISQLDPTLPASGDLKSEGDNHLRLLKATLQATFPNLGSAPVTATATDLSKVGVTQAASSNDTSPASTAYVQAALLASSGVTAQLPAQSGNSGKFLTTDGSSASWAAPGLVRSEVSGTTQTATSGNDYWLENVAATTVTAPTSADAAEFAVTPANGLLTNSIDFGAATVRGPGSTVTGTLTLNLGARMHFKYSSTLSQWVAL